MSDEELLYSFDSGRLTQICAEQLLVGQLAVADSWLVDEGRVRGLADHYERFSAWVCDINNRADLAEFCSAVTQAIPRSGRWFPRIEFLTSEISESAQLLLRLRDAPEQLETMTLWSYTEPDPRSSPSVKGPDLSLGLQMRRAAQMHGADEAVILDKEGFVAEGALSSLVWFRGDVLCAPGDDVTWLPSITRNEVFAIAAQMGIATRNEKIKPADLVGLEIWGLSSLHGIRPVDEWVDLGGPVGAPRHLDAFNKRLRMLSTSIDS